MLNVKALLTKILSCVYTTGTDGAWSYRKYADGTFEAWAAITYNIAVQTTWGSLYISASRIQVDLPSFVNTTTGWSVICSANGGELIRIVAKSSTSTPPFFTFTPVLATSRTAANRSLSVYVKGTWS